MPDFQVALAILTAGPDGSVVTNVAEMVVQAFLPLLKETSSSETSEKFAGVYSSSAGSVNSSISLVVDDGPGILIERWISNGSDILATAQAYSQATGGGAIESVRLYPTDLHTPAALGVSVSQAAFRAVFEMCDAGTVGKERVFSPGANAWANVDDLMYGNIAVDDFVFNFDANGDVESIEPRVVGVELIKQGGSYNLNSKGAMI